jgi:predicted P-loop ATPase
MEENNPTPALPAKGGRRERKKNWKEYIASVEDIQNFLMDRILLRHNVITGRVEYREPDEAEWAPISDRVVNSLWSELSAVKQTNAHDVFRVIESDFVPDFHPFRYYLEHLPPWDEQDHIMAMSVSVSIKGEVEEQLLFAQYLKKWLVGMVAGWVDPTVVNNVILVLIGEQGSYKTTWFNYLLPPELRPYFYTKTNANRMGRDDLLALAQYGLVCCEELDTMRPSELNQLKAAVTMTSIDERAAYAHYHEHRPHIASFCGTGNNAQFLSDPTGNRRWLPFEVTSIESPRDNPFDYTNIYAEAYALYRQGFQYWFSRDEILKLQEHNQQFETPNLETELIQQYFRVPRGKESGEFIPVSVALQIVGAGITQKLSAIMLGRAFIELGFRKKTFRNVRGYVVVRRSAEEMRSLRCQMAVEADNTHTDDTDVF